MSPNPHLCELSNFIATALVVVSLRSATFSGSYKTHASASVTSVQNSNRCLKAPVLSLYVFTIRRGYFEPYPLHIHEHANTFKAQIYTSYFGVYFLVYPVWRWWRCWGILCVSHYPVPHLQDNCSLFSGKRIDHMLYDLRPNINKCYRGILGLKV